MGLRTTAFDAAEAKGWSMEELAQRSGIPRSTLYQIKLKRRRPGPKVIPGIMRAFPDLPFERLFLPDDSAIAQQSRNIAEYISPAA